MRTVGAGRRWACFLGPTMKPQRHADWMTWLSEQLTLKVESQDWGIVNADSSRVEEFVRFFEFHDSNDSWEPEALGELILASANDGLVDGSLSDMARQRVVAFLRMHSDKIPHQMIPILWIITQRFMKCLVKILRGQLYEMT